MFVLKSTLDRKEKNWQYRYQNLEEHLSGRIRQLEQRYTILEQRYTMLLDFLQLEVHKPDPKPYLKNK